MLLIKQKDIKQKIEIYRNFNTSTILYMKKQEKIIESKITNLESKINADWHQALGRSSFTYGDLKANCKHWAEMNARDSTTVTTNENFFLKYKLPTSKGKLEFLADIYAKFGVSTTTNPLNRMRQNILDLMDLRLAQCKDPREKKNIQKDYLAMHKHIEDLINSVELHGTLRQEAILNFLNPDVIAASGTSFTNLAVKPEDVSSLLQPTGSKLDISNAQISEIKILKNAGTSTEDLCASYMYWGIKAKKALPHELLPFNDLKWDLARTPFYGAAYKHFYINNKMRQGIFKKLNPNEIALMEKKSPAYYYYFAGQRSGGLNCQANAVTYNVTNNTEILDWHLIFSFGYFYIILMFFVYCILNNFIYNKRMRRNLLAYFNIIEYTSILRTFLSKSYILLILLYFVC